MIEVINRELLIPREEYNIGTCYDDNTETRHFHLKRVTSGGVDLAALTFNLDIQYADGNTDAASLVKEVTDKDINLVLTINNSMLQVPGTVLVQIRALDEDGVCKWTSYKSAFFVEDHINTPGHYEGDLTQLEQYEAEWGKVRDNVNQLNLRMDQVVKLREKSPATEIEEEVFDGRVGYDGTEYGTLGTAIRAQFQKLDSNNKKISTVLTPEMFGAIGDGVTNDYQAFVDMFNKAIEICGSKSIYYDDSVVCYDFSKINFLFGKKYAIGSTLTINNAYGLKLDKLNLVAKSSFNGTSLITFGTQTRNVIISDCLFDCDYKVDDAIKLLNYKLNVQIVSTTIIKFNYHGIYVTDDSNGNELIVSNCKIYQYEYKDFYSSDVTKSSHGIGIYLGALQHDNIISDTIINYCVEYTLYLNGSGNNLISTCHFYGGKVRDSQNNRYDTCEFDGTRLEYGGLGSVENCIFMMTPSTAPFIEFYRNSGEHWYYKNSQIKNNVFFSTDGNNISTPFAITGSGYTLSDLVCDIQGNVFRNVSSKVYSAARNTIPYNYHYQKFDSCNDTSGTIRLGNLLIQYGTASAVGEITFPIVYDYFVPFVIAEVQSSAPSANPQCVNITRSKFNLTNNNGETVKWLSIGRQGY